MARKLVFLLAMWLLICLSSSQTLAQDPPRGIHLTWARNDTAHTIVVSWKTSSAEAGDVVLYDTVSRGGNPDLYRFRAEGRHETYAGANGYFHHVELTGLEPDTRYYFICGGEQGGWSVERSFRTAPVKRKSFRFVVGGDCRRAGDYDYGSAIDIPPFPEIRNRISKLMASFNPSFVIFVGDFVRDGFSQEQWDNWFEMVEWYWVDSEGVSIPIVPVIGNHEIGVWPQVQRTKDDARNYYGQFCLPEPESWYSLDWGPDLHITVLNCQETFEVLKGEEKEWLWKDLKANADKLWKVVAYHYPSFTEKSSAAAFPSEAWVKDGVFDIFHVDLVFNGHSHNYDRSEPINWLNPENERITSPDKGTIYIVTGGWGAPLTGGSAYWYMAHGPEFRYHFVVVDVYENGTLRVRAVDVDGNVFDEFSLHKQVKTPPAPREVPTLAIVGTAGAAVGIGAIAYALRRR